MFASADRAPRSKAGDLFPGHAPARPLPAPSPALMNPHALQGVIGNQATLRLLARGGRSRGPAMLQRAMRVSDPHDAAEQQAERIAGEAVNAPEQPAHAPRNEHASQPEISADVAAQIQSAPAGVRLPRTTRELMEPRLGADFGEVRVHNDNHADKLSRALDARAFTAGREIFFAQGEFAPESEAGRRLIAHELTHVVQQGMARGDGAVLLRQEQQPASAENPAPMPAQTADNQAPTGQDGPDEETEESSFQTEYSLSASNEKSVAGAIGSGYPLLQRQPNQPGKSAPPAPPAPQAPAAKPAPKVTPEPISVLDPKVGQTSNGKDGETKLTLQSHFKWTKSRKDGTITKFSGTVSRTIQTTFLPGVDPKANSGYGRGTTAEDKKAGNTSLGFHESCHVEDLKAYMDSHPLPDFTGKEGMSIDDFKAEVAKYDEALKKYWEAAGKDSEQSTDCVGTKASFCK